ncbi:chromobox protein homolog 1-like [Actinia tenebrosa]|uniref:Chromobox protein homolog 1-like n=1 Tax=Actinia tenebrosa TaxID=6105 RepID=A0A6P8HZ00_ACTTE|nr:chromobox protein homolog 1-like [Actinia tenebrosa]
MGKKKGKTENAKPEAEPVRVEEEFEEEEEYEVEKVVDKRNVNGQVHYLLKWKNYPDSDNTWEASEGLQCPELIAEFEKKMQEKKKSKGSSSKRKESGPSEKETKTKKRKVINTGSDTDQNLVMKAVEIQDAKLDQIDPISEGWEADSILGATEVDSQIHFLIQWRNTDRADLIPSKVANVKWPQIVIKFYEERVTWTQGESNSSETASNEAK